MKRGEIQAMAELLGSDFLERFKVIYPDTLFPPNWGALVVKACPLCGCKLKFPLRNKVVLCRSVKHKKPFVMALEKYKQFIHSFGGRQMEEEGS